jgi:niacin transporter
MNKSTKKITYSALFLALGVVFPQVFHLFGAGPTFLPMHIPVLLAGFFLGGSSAALVGIMSVLLSAALTGMPPVPILYFMLAELAFYGLTAGFTYRKLKLNVYISLVLSMIVGRIMSALTVFTLQPLLGLKISPLAYSIGLVTGGLPGIIIQLIFIPIIIFSVERAGFKFDQSAASK